MTITLDIQPETQAELARQAESQGRSFEAYAASLLEEAAHALPQSLPRRTGRDLIDASSKVRGLLTDAEVDALFARDPSFGGDVDFE